MRKSRLFFRGSIETNRMVAVTTPCWPPCSIAERGCGKSLISEPVIYNLYDLFKSGFLAKAEKSAFVPYGHKQPRSSAIIVRNIIWTCALTHESFSIIVGSHLLALASVTFWPNVSAVFALT